MHTFMVTAELMSGHSIGRAGCENSMSACHLCTAPKQTGSHRGRLSSVFAGTTIYFASRNLLGFPSHGRCG